MSDAWEALSSERKEKQLANEVPWFMTTAGYSMFVKKYSLPGETVRQRYETIALTAGKLAKELYDLDLEDNFFQIMWDGWLSPATPILANLGTNRGMPVSCSGGSVEDSVHGFYDSLHEGAILSKNGFGTSSYLGGIRARGSVFGADSQGKANGVVAVFEDFATMTAKISQGSQRRGAWAGYLEVDHGDFDELADLVQREPGGKNVGWIFTEDFIDRLTSGDSEALRRYQKILKIRVITGKGYIFKVDTANADNPAAYTNHGLIVKASQLCSEISLASDEDHSYTCQPGAATLVKRGIGLTTFDNVSIGDEIWSQSGWTRVVNKQSSGIKPVFSYETLGGAFVGTEDHRIIYGGEKVPVRDAEFIDSSTTISDFADVNPINPYFVLAGLLLGDGTLRNGKQQLCVGERDQDYYTSEIASLIEGDGYLFFRRLRDPLEVDEIDLTKNVWERDFRIDDFRGHERSLLRGLFSANGSAVLQKKTGDIFVTLTQTSSLIAYKAFWLLQSFGFSPRIYKTAGRESVWENGTYLSRDRYDVKLLRRSDVIRFAHEIGFIQTYKQNLICSLEAVGYKPRANTNRIHTITPLGASEVFHIEVDNTSHTYWTGGLEVSNCVLSSLNLAKYDEWKDTALPWIATVFLDCVAEAFIRQARGVKGLEKVVRYTEKARSLGLGVMGYHDLLQQRGLPFEGPEARALNVEIFQDIDSMSLGASQHMVEWAGEPEWCVDTGTRNTHRLAVAPTLSTALIVGGTSPGIEPFTANVWTQSTAAGEMARLNPNLVNVLKTKGIYNQATIDDMIAHDGSVQHVDWLDDQEKRVFLTAYEINQMEIIKQASDRQEFIDQAQSLNLFFQADASPAYISSVHRAALLDPRIKSLYYLKSRTSASASRRTVSTTSQEAANHGKP